jgi:hypothetical protein
LEPFGRLRTFQVSHGYDAISSCRLDHGLGPQFRHIIGRDRNAALLKPDPHLVEVAVAGLGTEPAKSDVVAGHLAGVSVIGYANRSGKDRRLADVGADAVADSLDDISAAIAEHAQMPSISISSLDSLPRVTRTRVPDLTGGQSRKAGPDTVSPDRRDRIETRQHQRGPCRDGQGPPRLPSWLSWLPVEATCWLSSRDRGRPS